MYVLKSIWKYISTLRRQITDGEYEKLNPSKKKKYKYVYNHSWDTTTENSSKSSKEIEEKVEREKANPYNPFNTTSNPNWGYLHPASSSGKTTGYSLFGAITMMTSHGRMMAFELEKKKLAERLRDLRIRQMEEQSAIQAQSILAASTPQIYLKDGDRKTPVADIHDRMKGNNGIFIPDSTRNISIDPIPKEEKKEGSLYITPDDSPTNQSYFNNYNYDIDTSSHSSHNSYDNHSHDSSSHDFGGFDGGSGGGGGADSSW